MKTHLRAELSMFFMPHSSNGDIIFAFFLIPSSSHLCQLNTWNCFGYMKLFCCFPWISVLPAWHISSQMSPAWQQSPGVYPVTSGPLTSGLRIEAGGQGIFLAREQENKQIRESIPEGQKEEGGTWVQCQDSEMAPEPSTWWTFETLHSSTPTFSSVESLVTVMIMTIVRCKRSIVIVAEKNLSTTVNDLT